MIAEKKNLSKNGKYAIIKAKKTTGGVKVSTRE